jgi:hypothetical protein
MPRAEMHDEPAAVGSRHIVKLIRRGVLVVDEDDTLET